MLTPMPMELFSVPVGDHTLLYAPLHGFAALVNSVALRDLTEKVRNPRQPANPFSEEVYRLVSNAGLAPVSCMPASPLAPLFLGLITTRDCNMKCKYCDFASAENHSLTMTYAVARSSVEAYFHHLMNAGRRRAEIQFFGGEPFHNNRIVEFTVAFAREQGRKHNLDVRFEVTTNGVVPAARAQWIADNIDAVVLSFDGSADDQNDLRPLRGGKGSFEIVNQTAKILSQGRTELIVRVCVSDRVVDRLPEIAAWIAENYVCTTVCFEALVPSELSQQNGLYPPDPLVFAQNVLQASWLLDAYGIEAVTSGTDLSRLQTSFCPLGKDALIVNPSGEINACYLLEEDWKKEGLDLQFGQVLTGPDGQGRLSIDRNALDSVRAFAQSKSGLCDACFCKHHCAGGCHVNHRAIHQAQTPNAVCIQTRAITIGRILKKLGLEDACRHWLDDPEEVLNTVNQKSFFLL